MRGIGSRRRMVGGVVLAACVVGFTSDVTSAVAAPSTVHGSATEVSECDYHVVPWLLPEHDPLRVAVTVASDASPQPHDSGPLTLSKTSVEVRIGAELFQSGVDAGIVGDGFSMPATVSATLGGSNTVEATRTFTQSMTTTLQVVDGVAKPLVVTMHPPDTVWHPDSRNVDVVFAEESARLVLELDLTGIGFARLTANCTPLAVRPFMVLAGTPETTTSAPPPDPTTSTSTGDPPIVNQATTVPGVTTLPRTGTSSGYAVFLGLSCIAAGALLAGRSRKHRFR